LAPVEQLNNKPQVLPAQHGWLPPPQAMQVLVWLEQVVKAPVQPVLPLQQACDNLPHPEQPPSVHVPLPGQAPPLAMHWPLAPSQQPPPVQKPPVQHASPEPPHGWHTPAPPLATQDRPEATQKFAAAP
jgi:hypothetical protein